MYEGQTCTSQVQYFLGYFGAYCIIDIKNVDQTVHYAATYYGNTDQGKNRCFTFSDKVLPSNNSTSYNIIQSES